MKLILLWVALNYASAVTQREEEQNSQFRTSPDLTKIIDHERENCEWKDVTDVVDGENCKYPLRECKVDIELLEGSGYIHYLDVGPHTMTGFLGDDAEFHCQKLPAHQGPEGSYMKGYAVRAVDEGEQEVLPYPPLEIKIFGTEEEDHKGHTDKDNDFEKWKNAHQQETIPLSTTSSQCIEKAEDKGTVCLGEQIMDGYGWKLSSQMGTLYHYFLLHDTRLPGAAPMNVIAEYATVYLTDPNKEYKNKMQSVIPAEFGVFGSYDKLEDYPIPESVDAITVRTFALPAKANVSGITYHMMSTEPEDEGWLVRGLAAELLDMDPEAVPEFFDVSIDDYGDSITATAYPLPELGYDTIREAKRGLESLLEKNYDRSKHSAKYDNAVLCKYYGNQIILEDIGRKDETGTIPAYQQSWMPGSYVRAPEMEGDNCGSFELEEGGLFSLVVFHQARREKFEQHSYIQTFIHFLY